ncbi:MAG: hypothetical protein LLF28_00165 [Nitrospiraceae bacterium]|nr:hypothetical protein [Nitrospiraceae bacterium]
MSIEKLLLIIESVLLLFTIVLILYSLKEGKSRKHLLVEVKRAVKILSRQEYFFAVTESMMNANSYVIGCITGRLPLGEDRKRTKTLMNNIEKLTKKGIVVKYLVPKFPDRLHIGYLYSKAGAEVRYSAYPLAHDFRYIVIDDRLTIIGVPASTGEKEATKKGHKIPSEGLASILKEHFHSCWDSNITHKEYLQKVLKQTGATPSLLAKELQIEEKELRQFIESAAQAEQSS